MSILAIRFETLQEWRKIMKVLYDHQIFTTQRYGGISRYFAELICRMDKKRVSIVFSNNEYYSRKFRIGRLEFKYINKFLSRLRLRLNWC